MCGFIGVIHRDGMLPPQPQLDEMRDLLRHRGPDDAGVYRDARVALGFRRLAILDPSADGRQPMSNEDGSLWIVFNGEVYNYVELRSQIESRHHFRSQTDTEVLLHLYEDLGPQMIEHLNGMFAFA